MLKRRSTLWPLLLGAGVAAGSAHAQSNDVFLGQTGDTNIITIDQTGANNLVGGASADLRLNQLGDRNQVEVLQVGESNGIGRINVIGQAGLLTGESGVATGLFQRGDANVLQITQRTAREGGANLVGAIDQSAGSGLQGPTNRATITQIGGSYAEGSEGPAVSTGPGFHSISEIVQAYSVRDTTGEANRLDVTQTGSRQAVEQLRQVGAGNKVVLTQDGSENALRIADQQGAANQATLRLSGALNAVGNVVQSGSVNEVNLRIDGDANFVDQIVQAGPGGLLEGRGNIARISIAGDDNGSEGIGGFAAMSGDSVAFASFAASVEQFGDDNSFTLTIGAEADGRADGNGFAAAQSGFGNESTVTMLGDENRMALRQEGDGNTADIVQTSSARRGAAVSAAGNIALVSTIGDINRVAIAQQGADNRMDARITGNDNEAARPLAGSARTSGAGLFQDGRGHRAEIDVLGDLNRLSLAQTGLGHTASITVVGSSNRSSIDQIGTGHFAESIQIGDGNYSSIQQD